MKHAKLAFNSYETISCLIDRYFGAPVSGAPAHVSPPAGYEPAQTAKSGAAPHTFSGLALHLGFANRNEMYRYTHKGKHGDTLQRALLQIEAEYEQKLYGQGTGTIFALKSRGWTDKLPEHLNDYGLTQDDFTVKLNFCGPDLAEREQDVIL